MERRFNKILQLENEIWTELEKHDSIDFEEADLITQIKTLHHFDSCKELHDAVLDKLKPIDDACGYFISKIQPLVKIEKNWKIWNAADLCK